MTDIHDTLAERGARYGDFGDHAKYVQAFLDVVENKKKWYEMKPDARQAIRVIFDKLARIMNGDPDYDDNWRDISGYATLVLNRIERDAQDYKREGPQDGPKTEPLRQGLAGSAIQAARSAQ